MRWGRLLLIVVVASSVSAAGVQVQGQDTEQARRAEGLVAIVGGSAPGPEVISILRSDVELQHWLTAGQGMELRVQVADLRVALLFLVREATIAIEARRVGRPPPTPEQIREQRERIIAAAGGDGEASTFFRRRGITRREIEVLAQRRALVGAFLATNVSGTTPRVADDEVDRVLASGAHPFVGTDPTSVRMTVRAWLARRELSAAVARWVRVLSQRTPVRYGAGWARPLDGGNQRP